QIDMDPQIPAISETEIIDVPELELTPAEGVDATEMTPLRISPDKPEIVQLDRSAVNILVGNDENLRAVPDTNRTIILIPKKPGATYFKAIDTDGKVIMQRHVIVGAAKNEYVRIRRACINGEDGCKQYSMYYCPDSCHEVDLIQDTKAASANAAPDKTTSPNSVETTNTDEPVTE
ncbi:MAG TPA: pilus assembly protein N-terminal domain-containing protein, partial [Alphaproteobacteria bacterium]|nr:pilus assembly protein N-terminal domain-containing protein [Alphaproteobacteria bacterium]